VFGVEPTGRTQVGRVVNVVDGDTIDVLVVDQVIRVRYIGIDTPEVHGGVEWMGREASAANERLVGGRRVVLEKDVSETDRYGRALRYVWLRDGGEWRLVNLALLRRGLATVATYPPDVKYVDALYLKAQRHARSNGLGLWGTPPTPKSTPEGPPDPPTPSNCHPSYTGYCLSVGTGDWDCAGGSGNGPNYLPVTVRVVGYDEFELDYDGDGYGCE
jgi:micrococcal nuclease